MLDHLSRTLATFPILVGLGPCRIRPLAVEDTGRVLLAVTVGGRLAGQTVVLVGPTQISFDDDARLVAEVTGKRRLFVRAPLAFHSLLARLAERVMTVPLISSAQVRMLEEEVVEAACAPGLVPDDLLPSTPFDIHSVRARLPEPGPFRLSDLRWAWSFRQVR